MSFRHHRLVYLLKILVVPVSRCKNSGQDQADGEHVSCNYDAMILDICIV